MIGVYIKYESGFSDTIENMRISHYTFDGSHEVAVANKDAGDGRIFRLKCPCGANNWSDNGRIINEYECICCGQYVVALEYCEPKAVDK